MRRSVVVFGLGLAILSRPMFAQSTWNGLRFGMSVSEVKEQLSAQGLELRAAEDKQDQYSATPAYVLEIKGIVPRLEFLPEMEFGPSGLKGIKLKLQGGKTLSGKEAEIFMLRDVVPEDLYRALTAKYGPPVNREGTCNKDADRLLIGVTRGFVGCTTTWRGDGQEIQSFWLYRAKFAESDVSVSGKRKPRGRRKLDEAFVYSIDYRPVSPGL